MPAPQDTNPMYEDEESGEGSGSSSGSSSSSGPTGAHSGSGGFGVYVCAAGILAFIALVVMGMLMAAGVLEPESGPESDDSSSNDDDSGSSTESQGIELFLDYSTTEFGTGAGQMIVYDGALYIHMNDGDTGDELHRIDKGATSPVPIEAKAGTDGVGTIQFLTVWNQALMFSGAIDSGQELLRLNVTAGETVPVEAFNFDTTSSGGTPFYFTPGPNGYLYMSASRSNSLKQLFAFDGETGFLAATVNPGKDANPAALLYHDDGLLYFIANTGDANIGEYNQNLFSFNGTTLEQLTNTTGSVTLSTASFKGDVYFCGFSAAEGKELWVYSPGEVPSLVADINTGSEDSSPGDFFVWEETETLYMSAEGSSGRHLYKYTGTGTPTMITGITSANSYPSSFVAFDGRLFFAATSTAEGRELWVMNTDESVAIVEDYVEGTQGFQPQYPVAFNGKLWFTGFTQDLGRELYTYTP